MLDTVDDEEKKKARTSVLTSIDRVHREKVHSDGADHHGSCESQQLVDDITGGYKLYQYIRYRIEVEPCKYQHIRWD